jgi:hypothetical protein
MLSVVALALEERQVIAIASPRDYQMMLATS